MLWMRKLRHGVLKPELELSLPESEVCAIATLPCCLLPKANIVRLVRSWRLLGGSHLLTLLANLFLLEIL